MDAGLIDAGAALSATSLTGYSGGRRKLIEQYEVTPLPKPLASPRPYGLTLAHMHIPEMRSMPPLAMAPVFMPVVSRFYKESPLSVHLHARSAPPR